VLNLLVAAFRQQYPTGSLVSDLLTIHNGLYVVRAVVIVDGHTLSTGLAAHETLETAEDGACERALSRLSLPDIDGSLAVEGFAMAAPQSASPKRISEEDVMAQPPSAPAQEVEVLPLTEPVDSEPLIADLTESQSAPLSIGTPPIAKSSGEASFTLEPTLLDAEEIVTSPIDLSDIIAQTDVELQRLGWGVSQGREFLEKTYGKRSRHDLTDEELLEFLLYLETQPSPVS